MDFDSAFRQFCYTRLQLMLGNIASDLDTLLTDLHHVRQVRSSKEDLPCTTGTIRSADTLGKDSFFSSTGDTSRQQGDAISSNHSLVSLSDNDHNDCDSIDSGHDGRCRSGPSPLVFDPHHFGPQCNQCSTPVTERVEISSGMEELRPISTVERLIKTNSIWLLATMSRAGAVHILKDRETGIFIVRKSSQPNSLALSVQSRLSDHPTVDHYLIEGSNYGFRLQGSAHFFHSIPALIAYYVENIDEIPYHLLLPSAIQQARSTRELASLDMLGQDFWVSSLSRKSLPRDIVSRILHKSCSEPINIQRPVHAVITSSDQTAHNTVPSKSASDFSHFMRTQQEMEQYFEQHLYDDSTPANIHANGTSSSQGRNDAKLEASHMSGNSHANQTPPPGGTAISSSTVQTFSQSCTYNSKEVTENGVVICQSEEESSQLACNSKQFNRLASECSWDLASSPVTSDKQQNKIFNSGAQHVDIHRSNSNNQPILKEDGIHSSHLHIKISDSSINHVLQDTSSLILNKTNLSREGVAKERSWTHPGSVPKLKSNLYFTTNLDLLDIPENSYFTSNLSDKLSDYEDIWRNSCCESDVDKMNIQMIHDPRAILDAKINNHKKNGIEGKRKVLRKTSKDSPPARRPVPRSRDAVTGGTTGLTALEQARMIAGSTSEDESSIPVAHVRGIRRMENMFEDEPLPLDTSSASTTGTVKPETFISERQIGSIQIPANSSHQIKFITSHSLDFSPNPEPGPSLPEVSSSVSSSKHILTQVSQESPSKCVFTTTMSVIVSESASSEQSSSAKINQRRGKIPLGHLSRLKSSSESSLATVSSPLYAEPADAVVLRDKNGKAINIQVRRRSAPMTASLKEKDRCGKDQTKVSQLPQLDTIFSPDAQSTISNNNAQSKFPFDTPNKKVPTNNNSVTNVSISRSQSMRTASEMSHLQSKQNWKDRLNRLKLGTKVLTQNLMEPTVPGYRRNISSEQRDLDSALFTDSSLTQTSRSVPGKFPVDKKNEMCRTSCFSESSTVQDLISCSHPELYIRPIAAKFMKSDEKTDATPPSEYDNLLVYRASTHSSLGTVYSPPWEGGTVNKLIRESPSPPAHILPPAMDIIERIERWQQSSSSYHGIDIIDNTVTISEKSISSQTQHSGNFEREQLIQRQQLLEHQQQIKIEESHKVQGFHHQLSHDSTRQHLLHDKNTDFLQQNKEMDKQICQDSGSKVASPPSSPQITKITSTSMGSGPVSSPHRLSSHCPDVVNCHNTSADQNISPLKDISSSVPAVLQPRSRKKTKVLNTDLEQKETKLVLGQHKSGSAREYKTPGTKIREYIFKLSRDRQTIFGSTIENFIQCTMESQETNPQHVMRNVRQFMTGIKNYLVKHGEGELENLIERERIKLGANEILNIDAIIEQALHICVLKPLKYHIYRLFVEKYSKNGALEQLSKNIKYARTKSAQDLGVKPGLKLPQNMDMEVIKHYLNLMQRSYSPLQKLQNLLNATSTIYHSVQGSHHHFPSRSSSLGAEDFLPILIYVIVHCGLVSAEIEADFMWGLLQPSLLTGEGGYYLTTLSSAVLILKNFQETHQLAPTQIEGKLPTLSDMQGFLKIAIPDELHGSITWKTLPVRPNMNTRDVCAMVAHKFRITNPQDYGLYLLCDGFESHMADSDCPQIIKGDNQALGRSCYFAFKRLDANIAWPKHMKHSPH